MPTPGELYEREMVPAIFARWASDLVAAAGVEPGARALDVACGTGVVTRLLAERVGAGGRVVGLDANPGMLAAARAAAPAATIEWLEGSAIKIPLPDAGFEAVLCQQGLQFFPDALARRIGAERAVLPPFSFGDPAALRALATGAGFRDVRVLLDAIVAEVAEQTRAYVDDEGWATSQVTHVLQAVA